MPSTCAGLAHSALKLLGMFKPFAAGHLSTGVDLSSAEYGKCSRGYVFCVYHLPPSRELDSTLADRVFLRHESGRRGDMGRIMRGKGEMTIRMTGTDTAPRTRASKRTAR